VCFYVVLRCMLRMFHGMNMVGMCQVCVVGRFFMIACFVMVRRFVVMARRMLMMLRRVPVMMHCFV
jgi:hypothetical protein